MYRYLFQLLRKQIHRHKYLFACYYLQEKTYLYLASLQLLYLQKIFVGEKHFSPLPIAISGGLIDFFIKYFVPFLVFYLRVH